MVRRDERPRRKGGAKGYFPLRPGGRARYRQWQQRKALEKGKDKGRGKEGGKGKGRARKGKGKGKGKNGKSKSTARRGDAADRRRWNDEPSERR